MRKLLVSLFAVVGATAIVLIACSKNGSRSGSGEEKPTTLKIHMTDNPINAEEVNVDLLQVRVNFRNDSTGWVDLNTNAGIYDLLGLQNGVDTLIASGPIPSNAVKEIRLVLGPNNSIKISGVMHPLMVPSGQQSGFKI
ncbi:MAG: DUF4382 domain-containing protein [Bacteroidetes bacterium]|nr:DUF4382 domain-containing protein [Bacteroidota bacterium]